MLACYCNFHTFQHSCNGYGTGGDVHGYCCTSYCTLKGQEIRVVTHMQTPRQAPGDPQSPIAHSSGCLGTCHSSCTGVGTPHICWLSSPTSPTQERPDGLAHTTPHWGTYGQLSLVLQYVVASYCNVQ